jgi:hypothetical protein
MVGKLNPLSWLFKNPLLAIGGGLILDQGWNGGKVTTPLFNKAAPAVGKGLESIFSNLMGVVQKNPIIWGAGAIGAAFAGGGIQSRLMTGLITALAAWAVMKFFFKKDFNGNAAPQPGAPSNMIKLNKGINFSKSSIVSGKETVSLSDSFVKPGGGIISHETAPESGSVASAFDLENAKAPTDVTAKLAKDAIDVETNGFADPKVLAKSKKHLWVDQKTEKVPEDKGEPVLDNKPEHDLA